MSEQTIKIYELIILISAYYISQIHRRKAYKELKRSEFIIAKFVTQKLFYTNCEIMIQLNTVSEILLLFF